MTRAFAIAVVAAVSFAIGASTVAAQTTTPLHESQYPDVDIVVWVDPVRGAMRHVPRPTRRCDWRRQPAQRQVPERAAAITISRDSSGRFAGRGDAAVRARQLRDGRHRRLPSQHDTFDTATVKAGDVDTRPRCLRRQGWLRGVPSHGRVGSRVAPNLSDIGSQRSPARYSARSLDPSSQMMPINRPVRAGEEGRHDRQRPAAQRGHLQHSGRGR